MRDLKRLKDLMVYFISAFPQRLGRTKLIKSVYLLDCEWYRLYGETYSGLNYLRDYNGPFDVAFYDAKDALCAEGVITELEYLHSSGKGYEYVISGTRVEAPSLQGLALNIASDIVEELKYAGLNDFLRRAYNTEPMKVVQDKERDKRGHLLLGEVLDMDELRKPPKALFSFKQVKRAGKRVDMSSRGSDEEYSTTVAEEIRELKPYLERALKSWQVN
ncbi:hypothetical protein LLE49_24105 [Alicyclobacillus tolerans]|uniref:hypothetical protein n=1 Tax=Alicyclobacillus tolerans TaxID=90970 RepID=UPI001F329F74|nr:hypothetical protein [Alicyclobacillus tolerans]MCF8567809.1 hypothetical protein [Alicyclobacillus tolerans]